MVSLGQSLGFGVHRGGFEEDEDGVLAEHGLLRANCLDFSISDTSESSDGTRLWNEALVEARRVLAVVGYEDTASIDSCRAETLTLPNNYYDTVAQTRLGSACRKVIQELGLNGGAIGLLEGGIERVVSGSPGQCLDRIFRLFLVPWDCGPSAIYVWK
jgi:hypothetical protein